MKNKVFIAFIVYICKCILNGEFMFTVKGPRPFIASLISEKTWLNFALLHIHFFPYKLNALAFKQFPLLVFTAECKRFA